MIVTFSILRMCMVVAIVFDVVIFDSSTSQQAVHSLQIPSD